MKKFMAGIITAAMMLAFPAAILANSGPVFWQGYPSADSMFIKENSPIRVNHENLVYDFSERDHSSYSLTGRVTAAYEMFNPTNEHQTIQMAFPFVSRLDSLLTDNIVITADDQAVPYDIYIGDVVNNYGNPRQEDQETGFEFAHIVKTVTHKSYQTKNFAKDEKGKLYLINVNPIRDQRINFTADLVLSQKTKVLTNGFNRFERHGDKIRLAAWCYKPSTLEIYVLGEDIDLTVNAYTDGELKNRTNLFSSKIGVQEVEVKPYLMKYIKENTSRINNGKISDIQLYNLYAKTLDESFSRSRGYSSGEELFEQEMYQRLITLVYTVDFPENSAKNIRVSYKTTGTMDKTKTMTPQYSFDYLLNPAKNWSAFKNLTIAIIPPEEAPNIIKSSIQLTRGEDNVYRAALAGLPEHDLSFTLYAHEKITIGDKAGKSLRSFGYFLPFIIGMMAIFIIGFIIAAFIVRKKNPPSIGD